MLRSWHRCIVLVRSLTSMDAVGTVAALIDVDALIDALNLFDLFDLLSSVSLYSGADDGEGQ